MVLIALKAHPIICPTFFIMITGSIPQFFQLQSAVIHNPNSPDLFNLNAVLYAQDDIKTPVTNNTQCLEVPSFNYLGNVSESGSDDYASGYTSSTTCGTQQIWKPKRKRRLSNQISRIYKCDFPECKKAYEKPSHLKTHKFRKNHVK